TLGDRAGYPVRKDVYKKGIAAIKQQLRNVDLDPTTRAYMMYSLSYADNTDTKLYEEQFLLIKNAEMNDYSIALLAMTARNIGDTETANMYTKLLVSHAQDMGESGSYWGGKTWHYRWQDDKVQTTAMALKAFVN
ncbi:MAG TPA: hypothetical protein PKA39_10960, partial [Ignavibacteria bacterium]|nr:hypothetical protein [Ignavibacteria bacterium]